ncbi:coiled-coil domain-containing protein 55-domain containing protein [Lasiosphaeria miniovina]|uniref:Coiled-coil domain-containing protein 55-domain containing protein n=1 Tax=Lasiosphaeria miniovina TaxID=1954250 RepID=A0AA40AVG8_9PEZI|nr:coiled-coil domain-containing protein 55-domain containing protein [Lasiosphaeria miniovina]KAK0722742.1 coiled-coil domain-containing protein 55-domain containing protein [Lasiosphaeria miniovina]
MSKLFSFGLKKSAPSKPPPPRRKPATFGGDDDDDGNAPENNGISGFDTIGASTGAGGGDAADEDSDDAKGSRKKKKFPNHIAPPPPLGTKSKLAAGAVTQFGDLSSALESRRYAEAAEGADPSIYDYDGVYDSLKLPAKKKKDDEDAEGAAGEKRPRYFDALQKAAEVRERDRLIAEEKRLKREREAEGDAFADKEKFVTEAYKKQQEENRRLEAEEKLREEAEAKKNKNRGMADFYKQMLDRGEEEHAAKIKAVEELKAGGADAAAEKKGEEDDPDKEKSATQRAREINAMGGSIILNGDGEVVDMRQLLKGGLNVAPKKKTELEKDKAKKAAAAAAGRGGAGAGIGSSGPTRGIFVGGGKQAMRERQTRMLEAQLEETLKRSREEEEEEQAKVELSAKSRKTESDISSAKERYLARKRAAEEAKKNGLADVP